MNAYEQIATIAFLWLIVFSVGYSLWSARRSA